MKYDIIIGLPSYNEADSITHVTQQVDQGLKKFFPDRKALIINGDSASTDRTVEVFKDIATDTPKETIVADKKGKGVNMFNILNRAREYEAEAIAFFDTDVKSVSEDWVVKLVGPILEGNGFVAPYFIRSLWDGTITNQFAYPFFYSLYGVDIRQPIGGEVALSGAAADTILESPYPPEVERYGIDIFMATTVASAGFKVAQASLGVKSHKPSLSKLDGMFFQVADTFFKMAKMHRSYLNQVRGITDVSHEKLDIAPPVVKIDKEYLAEKAASKEHMDSRQWLDLVSEHFGDAQKLTPYFFQRVLSFFDEVEDKSFEMGEKMVQDQANMFFDEREKLIEKLK
jgi:glycosyltransferase involved in cell wall biosynthesis